MKEAAFYSGSKPNIWCGKAAFQLIEKAAFLAEQHWSIRLGFVNPRRSNPSLGLAVPAQLVSIGQTEPGSDRDRAFDLSRGGRFGLYG